LNHFTVPLAMICLSVLDVGPAGDMHAGSASAGTENRARSSESKEGRQTGTSKLMLGT